MQNVERKLSIYFAIMACLCGLTFAGVPDLAHLPVIAVFVALFGLVFVDALKWFSLPPAMAYVALGAIAFYTLAQFASGATGTEPQMAAVAELLVYVQAVLMLQRKSRRIYEQLTVFALLELIVAAIFNNAISYGLLLLPLCVVALGALSLLHVYSTSEDAFSRRQLSDSGLLVSSAESDGSFARTGALLPRIGLLTIAPATMVVSFVFFYALPRTNQESKRGLAGRPQVGFSSEVSLGQIGRMLQNPEVAARIEIKDRRDRTRYDLAGDFYLRGAVLENYNPDGDLIGKWGTADGGDLMSARQLPRPPIESAAQQRLAGDDVAVRISVSPMKDSSLFSLPPYYFHASGSDVLHKSDRWTIVRRKKPSASRESQISYQFATRAFRDGLQSRFLPRFAADELVSPGPVIEADSQATQNGIDTETVIDTVSGLGKLAKQAASRLSGDKGDDAEQATSADDESEPTDQAPRQSDEAAQDADAATQELDDWAQSQRRARYGQARLYREACLVYDIDMVPSAERLADSLIAESVRDPDNPVEVARAMESYLASDVDYQYTLDLTMTPVYGVDPVEQFLSVHRAGNCQHFASALVLMLRSQGIPARLVVGFHTDEYNNIGGYYVARQLHAHAWVEALIDAKWLKADELDYSANPPQQYWFRLDPTPGGGGTDHSAGGRVADVFDLAQDIWTSYVVEADAADRRREAGIGSQDMSSSYQLFYEGLKLRISRIRAGELGAGALAGREWFSWWAAVIGVLIALGGIAVYQLVIRGGWASGRGSVGTQPMPKPSIPFFAEAVAMLERLGILRSLGQTPKEYMAKAAIALDGDTSPSLAEPLSELTSAFYFERFAPQSRRLGDDAASDRDQQVEAALERIRQRVDQESQRG